jgi:DnaJ-class molecular chaperone
MNSQTDDIFKMAEKIAQTLPTSDGDKEVDMQEMVKHVTESVMGMMGNGDVDINGMTSNLMQGLMSGDQNNPMAAMMQNMMGGSGLSETLNGPADGHIIKQPTPIKNSKIDLSVPKPQSRNQGNYKFKEPQDIQNFEELDDNDSEASVFSPRTKDININLNIRLDEFYTGANKKLAIRRKRLRKNKAGKIVQVEEKKKIVIPIIPGMRDEQVIRFNKEADEAQGHESGDIVVTLCENVHSKFEREGDNLFIIKDISLYEAFAASCGEKIELNVKHLDGTILRLKTDGKPLHNNDGLRKVIGDGMPLYKKNEKGNLYVRFNLVLPDKFKPDDVTILKKLFPSCNEVEVFEGSVVRDVELEEVSESDMEELDYGYSDDESDYSDTSSDYSESSEEHRKGFRKIAGKKYRN